MKKVISITTCLFLLLNCFSQKDWDKEYYSNGSFKKNLVNSKKNGEWKMYFSNGNLWEIGHLKDGNEDGEWKLYWENGKIRWHRNYKNGILDGEWKMYYQNGNTSELGQYTNGKRNGEWKLFYENGKFWRSENYKNGKKNVVSKNEDDEEGMNFTFDKSSNESEESGVKIFEITKVENGFNDKIILSEPKLIKNGGITKKLDKDGEWKSYHKNRVIAEKGYYIKNKKDGEWFYYENNGLIKERGKYIDDKKVGDWYYYKSNKLQKIEVYEYGKLISVKIIKENI